MEAHNRALKHLDIVEFIRSQMILKVMQRVIFTQQEIRLLRKQRDPFVLSSQSTKFDQHTTGTEYSHAHSPHLNHLLKGAVVKPNSEIESKRQNNPTRQRNVFVPVGERYQNR